MLKNSILLFLFAFILFVPATFGQAVYEPTRDSAERKAIMNALRVPVEKELKTKTIFAVSHLKVQGSWAFMTGTPQKADGSQMDYRGTIYEEAQRDGVFDDGIVALLKKTGGKWRVVKHQIGATDVPYVTWWKDYKAPKAIFPYTEN
jgi:hypothetical protein